MVKKIKTAKNTHIEDITGDKFGRLTVIELTDKKNNDGRWLWKCQCSCGNVIEKSMHDLRSGHHHSCGCLRKELRIQKNKDGALNITGQRRGTLTAIEPIDEESHSGKKWLVRCDCGYEFITTIGEWNRSLYGDKSRQMSECPVCGKHNSIGEKTIAELLNTYNISFIKEWTDNGKCKGLKRELRFDFYLPEQRICIEYDGEQHFKNIDYFGDEKTFEERLIRDQIKNEYCEDNNIKLIRIPYFELNKLNKQYLEERGVKFD